MAFKDIFKKILPSSQPDLEWNHASGKSFDEQKADLGAFQYTDDGFTYTRGDFTRTLKWSDITQLNVYKIDLMTIDEVRMEIVYGEKFIEISEEIPGWSQFVLRTKKIFPSIPRQWDSEIIQQPFETNYRTIYSAGT
mgnify:CR=1 FL=1